MVKIDLGASDPKDSSQLETLCSALLVPGNPIPVGADQLLADGLLARNFDSTKLCAAALSLLGSNPQVVEFAESALLQNTALLDRKFDDGTLVAFLNAPLMKALLRTTPIPNVAFERLLTYIRERFLKCTVDSNWYPFNEATEAAVSMAIYCYLTDYIFPETEGETAIVDQLEARLTTGQVQGSDLYAVAVMGTYRPLSGLSAFDTAAINSALQSDSLAEDLLRVQVAEPEKELELVEDIDPITEVTDSVSQAVQAQYEENPYPRWMTHIDNDPVPPATFFSGACSGVNVSSFRGSEACSVLVAGCGTGKVAIEEALLWRESDLLAMDLSRASLAFGQRRSQELGLSNITFVQGDLLELAKLEPSFDYVTCTGVLHHMADPAAGFRALSDVCRPGGVIRIGVYSARARKAVQQVREMLGSKVSAESAEDIREARQSLIEKFLSDGTNEHLQHVFSRLDTYNLSMCRDLLFHVHEQDFTIPKIKEVLSDLRLRFCGFVDPTGELLKSYQEFAPQDLIGLDLDSWHQYEEAHPHTFVGMYDFMVQKPV